MKLKNDKHCHRHTDASPQLTPCRYGYCTILRCSFCGLIVGDWGPIDCPHKKNENGTLRWYKYPDMDTKPHVPVKH